MNVPWSIQMDNVFSVTEDSGPRYISWVPGEGQTAGGSEWAWSHVIREVKIRTVRVLSLLRVTALMTLGTWRKGGKWSSNSASGRPSRDIYSEEQIGTLQKNFRVGCLSTRTHVQVQDHTHHCMVCKKKTITENKEFPGTQLLGLWASMAGVIGSIPGWGNWDTTSCGKGKKYPKTKSNKQTRNNLKSLAIRKWMNVKWLRQPK